MTAGERAPAPPLAPRDAAAEGGADGAAPEAVVARAADGPDPASLRKESTEYLAMGLGVGAFGIASAVIVGSVCPVCIVATPALLGAGAFRRWQARRRAAR